MLAGIFELVCLPTCNELGKESLGHLKAYIVFVMQHPQLQELCLGGSHDCVDARQQLRGVSCTHGQISDFCDPEENAVCVVDVRHAR